MPFSDAENRRKVCEWYQKIQPKVVVDVGPGDGTYAKLLRPLDQGDVHWTGIEVWGPYVDKFGLLDHYNDVIVADARYVDPYLFRADVVFLCDVLEHMTSAEAVALLRAVTDRAENVIVSVPVLHLDQGDWEGNPYETHVDHWHHANLVRFLREEMDTQGVIVDQVEGKVLSRVWWQAAPPEVSQGVIDL